MKTYYNYIYLDTRKPGDYYYEKLGLHLPFEPFYVGKGIKDRYLDHLIEAYEFKDKNDTKKNKFKCRKIRKIKKITGHDPAIIKINYTNNETESLINETLIIKVIGRANKGEGPLCNLTDGGNGGNIVDKNHPSFKEINQKRVEKLIKHYRPKQDVIQLIVKWYVDDRETIEEIKRRLKTIHPSSQKTIKAILIENGIELRSYIPDNTYFFTEKEKEEMIDLNLNKGKTKREICKIFGICGEVLNKIFKEKRIVPKLYQRNKPKFGKEHPQFKEWTENELKEILKLRTVENWDVVRLIRYFHTNQECLLRAFNELGISGFKIKVKPKPNALTEEKQNEVRKLRKEKCLTHKEIALRFNISKSYVGQILQKSKNSS